MKKDICSFLEKLEKERILIVGFCGKTGISTAKYLLSKNIKLSLSDVKDKKVIEKTILKELTNKDKIQGIYSGEDKKQLDNIDRIILSPGVARKSLLIKEALYRNITVTNEIELAFLLCPTKKVIGITGTDGKSTTAVLVYEILKKEIKDIRLGGNIGTPFISFVDELSPYSTVVLELSSYMLEGSFAMPLSIACLLNLAPDHMDRYDSFKDYILAKKNIFKGQTNKDYAIVNKDDKNCLLLSSDINAKIRYFSTKDKDANIFCEGDAIFFKGKKILSIKDAPLGMHNKENIIAALSCALLSGISITAIKETLKTFNSLEHRCEYVDTIKGIRFINDSKATTIQAVEKALVSHRNVILLMGGQNKSLSFEPLKKPVQKKAKALILYGEAKSDIDNAIEHKNTYIAENLKEALSKALEIAIKDDTIMLSPACTSFDQFANYKKRGEYFKALVIAYKASL